jgi:hypothetical protein
MRDVSGWYDAFGGKHIKKLIEKFKNQKAVWGVRPINRYTKESCRRAGKV